MIDEEKQTRTQTDEIWRLDINGLVYERIGKMMLKRAYTTA